LHLFRYKISPEKTLNFPQNLENGTKIGFGGATGILTGYAYETIPNKAIIAGKTHAPDEEPGPASLKTRTSESATLGMLALGAPGLSIWRREDSDDSARSSSAEII
jgi:hypothetical protein